MTKNVKSRSRHTAVVIALLIAGLSKTAVTAQPTVLSWTDCVREAASNNPALAASLEVVNQRRAQRRMATSPMLPQINASAGAAKTDDFSGTASRDTNTYSVKGEQLIFDGFKSYNEFKVAEQNLGASEHAYTQASADIRFGLRRAFVDLLTSQQLVPITQGIIERRQQNLDMIRLRYESGREHQGSMLLAEADLAQARFDHGKALRGVSVAQYALRKEMGWKKETFVTAAGKLVLSHQVGNKPDLRALADTHPDVLRIAAEKEAAGYGVQSAKSEFFPNLSAAAEAGKVRAGGFAASDHGWSVGVNAAVPIFDGARRVNNTERAQARLREAAAGESGAYDSVVADLESAWQRLKDAVDYEQVQKKYLEADEVRAKIARAQYANGLLMFDNWIIIEDNYVRSQKTYVQAQADMLIAEAQWLRAKGEALVYE